MRFMLWILSFLLISGFPAPAQEDDTEEIPKFIFWKEADQVDTITTDKPFEIQYYKLDRENYYMRLIQHNEKKFSVTLKAYATKAKPKPIEVAQSIYIPEDGTSPISFNKSSEKSDRVITFTYIGQREKIKSGELVNIIYQNLKTDKIYISYESSDDGYWLELTSLHEMKRIRFDKLCQVWIVATPELTTIEFSDDVRYEQIIWTPREDNSWEVRMGAVERGCKSEALRRIEKLRTKEYMENVPKETKNMNGK